jgi:hypothetical protein
VDSSSNAILAATHASPQKWGRRPAVYRVTLFFDKIDPLNPGPGVLGIEPGTDAGEHLVIVNFYRHPQTGKPLPAERSGRILLMDRLLAVDNTSFLNFSANEAMEFLSKLPGPGVTLTLMYVEK